MHEVVPGTADKSYGIHVAALAGLPHAVLQRSEQILGVFEAQQQGAIHVPAPVVAVPMQIEPSTVEQDLADLDIDNLSPRQALDVLYSLKSQLHKSG